MDSITSVGRIYRTSFKPLVQGSNPCALTKIAQEEFISYYLIKKNRVNVGFVAEIHPESFLPPLHPASKGANNS